MDVSMHICICMHILCVFGVREYVHACVHAYSYIYTHNIYTCTFWLLLAAPPHQQSSCVYAKIFINVQTHIRVSPRFERVCACIHVCVYAYLFTYAYHLPLRVCVDMYSFTCICTRVHIYI